MLTLDLCKNLLLDCELVTVSVMFTFVELILDSVCRHCFCIIRLLAWMLLTVTVFTAFLDRLFDRVDLIKPVCNVRSSVRPQKVSLISIKFGV